MDKYADEGVTHIEDVSVLKVQPLNQFGTPVEIIKSFGGKDGLLQAIRELETLLYSEAA